MGNNGKLGFDDLVKGISSRCLTGFDDFGQGDFYTRCG